MLINSWQFQLQNDENLNIYVYVFDFDLFLSSVTRNTSKGGLISESFSFWLNSTKKGTKSLF